MAAHAISGYRFRDAGYFCPKWSNSNAVKIIRKLFNIKNLPDLVNWNKLSSVSRSTPVNWSSSQSLLCRLTFYRLFHRDLSIYRSILQSLIHTCRTPSNDLVQVICEPLQVQEHTSSFQAHSPNGSRMSHAKVLRVQRVHKVVWSAWSVHLVPGWNVLDGLLKHLHSPILPFVSMLD